MEPEKPVKKSTGSVQHELTAHTRQTVQTAPSAGTSKMKEIAGIAATGGTAVRLDFLLEAHNIYCIYGSKDAAGNVVALKGINLKMKHGEFVSIVGPSGAGKSSLLRILGGLQQPTAGSVIYNGIDITKLPEEMRVDFRRRTVGYIFQEGNLIETVSAFQNVVQTMMFAGFSRSAASTRAKALLTYLGLEKRMHDLPMRLSGGERQRVAIARALANNPQIVLADEPTGNLDYENADKVMKEILRLREKFSTSFLVVTHNRHVASFSDRSIELRDGRFIGQHGVDMDIANLELSRQVIISHEGNLTLPPEYMPLIEKYGDIWEFRFEFDKEGSPKIVAKPAALLESVKKTSICPVCKAPVGEKDFSCRACGAALSGKAA